MPFALLALAIGAFCIGTTEFVTAGILPDIATFFKVSIPMAGSLTSVYALSVAVGAPLITAITIKMQRKHTLIILMSLFIIGSAISALASNFAMLMFGRITSALCHGAFFGIGAVVASNLVSENKRASAIAFMFTGLTLANVLGVPIGTVLGQHFGWRVVFGVITVLGIICLVPNSTSSTEGNLKKELAVFKRGGVWLSLLITAFGFSGVFASFTYIAPLLTDISGFLPSSIGGLLVLFGIGLVIGNILGGKAADKALIPSLYGVLILLALLLVIFTFTAHYKIPAAISLFIFGILAFGTVAPLQMQLMQQASEAPTLASAANIAAFNLGNAGGVFLGGLAISEGFSYVSPNWVAASLTTVGLFLAIINNAWLKNSRIVKSSI
ncbi:MAG: araJ [Burkholderiales bacterium]|nr:araJ [Burkholderiales bacterium]